MPKNKKSAARLPPKEPAGETRVSAAEFPAAATEATEPPDSARHDPQTSDAHVADDASSEAVPIATAGPASPEEEEARGAERVSDSARDDPRDPLATGAFETRDPASGLVADPRVSEEGKDARQERKRSEDRVSEPTFVGTHEEHAEFSDEEHEDLHVSASFANEHQKLSEARHSDDPAVLRSVVRELEARDAARADALVALRDRQLAIADELVDAAESERAAREALDVLSRRAENAERRAAEAEARVAEALRRRRAVETEDETESGSNPGLGLKSPDSTEHLPDLPDLPDSPTTLPDTGTTYDGKKDKLIESNESNEPPVSRASAAVMDLVTRAAEDAANALNEKSRERALKAAAAASARDAERRTQSARDEAARVATEQWSTKLELVKAEHRDRVEELERTVAELRAALTRAESEAAETADSTRSELDLTERALRDAETRAADSARGKEDAESRESRLATALEAESTRAARLESELNAARVAFSKSEARGSEKMEKLEAEMDAARAAVFAAEAETARSRNAETAERSLRENAQTTVAMFERERARHESRVAELEGKEAEARARRNDADVKRAEAETALAQSRVERSELRAELMKANDDTRVAREKITELERALMDSRVKATENAANAEQKKEESKAARARVAALERALADATRGVRSNDDASSFDPMRSNTALISAGLDDSALIACDETRGDSIRDGSGSLNDGPLLHRDRSAKAPAELPEAELPETLALLRRELDATRSVAAMQEEEVCRAAAAAAASADAPSVPRALLERWRAETFKLLLQQREAPVLLAQAKRDFARQKAALRETIADEKKTTALARRALAESEAKRRDAETSFAETKSDLQKQIARCREETANARHETNRIANVFAEHVGPRLETEFARLETTVVAKTARLDRAARRAGEELARARGTLASKRQNGFQIETTLKKRIASLTKEADTALAQRDAALEAVRETARNFDDERARLTTELKETRRRLDASERDVSEIKNERDAARREVVSVARAADKQAVETAARAARDGAQRERERHEAATRRFRLEAETAQKEAERCASLLNRAELVAARDKKEAEAALVAERAAFDATVAKRDAAIRELKVARDALLAERRELKASAAAADASRRVERAARRETLDALERVKHAPGSPAASPRAKSGTPLTGSIGSPKPTPTPPRLSPAKSARTKTRAPLGALLSRAGGVPGASARTPPSLTERRRTVREPFSEVSEERKEDEDEDEDVSFGARLPPVSLEDLEKSPSWQLQRRLESLEARAAALLLDEEEEAARR